MNLRVTAPSERRTFDRFAVNLTARFLHDGVEQDDAVLLDLSATGAAVRSKRRPRPGEPVVVYAASGIRLTGTVSRWFAGGFAIAFEANEGRLNRVLDRLGLTTKASRDAVVVPEAGKSTQCSYADGTPLEGRVTNASIVGVTVASRSRPAIGTPVIVGRARGLVARHQREGFTVEFDAFWETSARNARVRPETLKTAAR